MKKFDSDIDTNLTEAAPALDDDHTGDLRQLHQARSGLSERASIDDRLQAASESQVNLFAPSPQFGTMMNVEMYISDCPTEIELKIFQDDEPVTFSYLNGIVKFSILEKVDGSILRIIPNTTTNVDKFLFDNYFIVKGPGAIIDEFIFTVKYPFYVGIVYNFQKSVTYND